MNVENSSGMTVNTLSLDQIDGGLYVCPLRSVPDTVSDIGASHLVTLINLDMMVETPPPISPENHLRLGMNDIVEPVEGLVIPNEDHVSDLLTFVDAWDHKAPMVIHCWAGISRSTAAAFISLCMLNPDQEEVHIARQMRQASATAYPNSRLVEIADRQLGRNGNMCEAIETIGRGELAMEGNIFGMPARFSV